MHDQTAVKLSGCPGDTEGMSSLGTLIELVMQRLALGQDVAVAKYVSGQPIDDPVREREILESVARALDRIGLRQEIGMQFLRDQIEANKVIQRGLHLRWYVDPDAVPAVRCDLAVEVRPRLDRITARMIRHFMRLREVPQLRRDCFGDLIDEQFSANLSSRQLCRLHRQAAFFALRSFCLEG